MAEIKEFKQVEENSRGTYEYRQERARQYINAKNLRTRSQLRQAITRFGETYRNVIGSLDSKLAQPDEEFYRDAMPTIEEIDKYIAEQNRRYHRENNFYDDNIWWRG